MKIESMKVKDLIACLEQLNPENVIDFEGDVYDVNSKLGINCNEFCFGLVRVKAGTHNAFGMNIQVWPDIYEINNTNVT